jgi:hypothetical protein
MSTARFDEPYLTHDELSLLIEAVKGQGDVTADVPIDGQFSEERFLRFETLERLVLRGYLAYVGQSNNEQETSYYYSVRCQS